MMHPENRSICAERVEQTLLSVTGPNPILDDAFESYLEQVAQSVTEHGPFHCFLSYSLTQGPSAKQRRMVQEREHRLQLKNMNRVALISQSTLVRGAITAAAWLIPGKRELRAFPAAEVDHALAWLAESDLALDPKHCKRVLATLIEAAGF